MAKFFVQNLFYWVWAIYKQDSQGRMVLASQNQFKKMAAVGYAEKECFLDLKF
jgi:hypothetical protein